jgi:hypothetical protein
VISQRHRRKASLPLKLLSKNRLLPLLLLPPLLLLLERKNRLFKKQTSSRLLRQQLAILAVTSLFLKMASLEKDSGN